MRLHEYKAKEFFKSYGIRVPRSYIGKNGAEVENMASKISLPVIMKPQVLVGGRGKAGVIKKVSDPSQLAPTVERLMIEEVSGVIPESILIEEFIPHEKEFYLSVALDRGRRSFVAVASGEGGVEVEGIKNKIIHPLGSTNLSQRDAAQIASTLRLRGRTEQDFAGIVRTLSRLSSEKDAELVEINPLAQLYDGSLMALDAKVIIDDNALFRQQEFQDENRSGLEAEAVNQGFAFVELEGNVAVIGNGAGLVLSTLDLVKEKNMEPACFLDLGGGASFERISAALSLVDRYDRAETILLNIFGGITSGADVAEAILDSNRKGRLRKPLFARISGADEKKARLVLDKLNLKIYGDAEEAISALGSAS